MKMNDLQWAVYDVFNDTVIGVWTDVCDADEFLQENETEDDMWAVFHTLDVLEVCV